MTRRTFIEQTRRQIYGGQPSDDAEITVGLVNVWLNEAIGVAAKKNLADNLQMDGLSYVNNSFYTSFKGLAIAVDDQFTYKITLPEIPFAIGQNEGISAFVIKDSSSNMLSLPIVWLTANQKTFFQSMRPIPNKLLGISESKYVYLYSTLLLNQYTANVTMVSGGDSTNLDSELNVPADYLPVITDYLRGQLMFQRQVPQDVTNDGMDAITTT